MSEMTLRRVLPGYVLAIPLGLLATVWAIICVTNNEFLTAVVSVSFGVMFISMTVPSMRSITSRIEPRVSCNGLGTTVRSDLIFDVATFTTIAAAVFSCVMFAIFQPLGMLDIPVPHSLRYSIPFLAGVVGLMGVPFIWLMIHRGGTKYLRLTPAGYEVAEGYKPERGGWDEIIDVTRVVPESIRQVPNALVLMKSDGTAAVLAAGPITPGGRDLRELVRFYWQHPAYRDELADDRALERLRHKNFAADR